MLRIIMKSDELLSELSETFDRFSDLQFVIENISEIAVKDKQKIEAIIKYRIFELHMMLGKIWDK